MKFPKNETHKNNIHQLVSGQQSKLHENQNETHNDIRMSLRVGNKVNCIKSNQSKAKMGTHNDISQLCGCPAK
jgi:hypothetical protein